MNGERGENKAESDRRFFWKRIEKGTTGMARGKKIIEKKDTNGKKRKQMRGNERNERISWK